MLAPALAAALATAVATSRIGDGCTPPQVRAAIAKADVRPLGRVGGDPVVLVALEASCMCGNVNCPWLVVRTGHATSVLSTYAFDVGIERSAEPLPRPREHAHDSALITDETLDAYRGGSYAPIASWRVRGDTGARKPDAVPVSFAPGTSGARLRGTVALSWYDDYAFNAAQGQRLTVGDVASKSGLTMMLFLPGDAGTIEVKPGVAVALPRSGTFKLHVEGGEENDQPYALTLSIR